MSTDTYDAQQVNKRLLKLIVRTVAEWFGVSQADLLGTGRARQLVRARWAVWMQLRDKGRYSYTVIAAACGVTHGAVLHGIRRAKQASYSDIVFYNPYIAASAIIGETLRLDKVREDRAATLRLRLAELTRLRDNCLAMTEDARASGKPWWRHCGKAVALEEAMALVNDALYKEGN